MFFFSSTHWADFLAGTKEQRMRGRRGLPAVAADLSRVLSRGDVNPWIHSFQHMSVSPISTRPISVSSSEPRSIAWQSDVSGTRKYSMHLLSTAFFHVLPISCCEKRESWINLFNWNVGSLLLPSFKLLLDSCYLDF